MYQRGINSFIETNNINTIYDFFAKSNEIHTSSDSRPRAIFNPGDSLKAIGSYIARFFIKLMKEIEPGFISGYND